jgi:hypothetical protein
MSAEAGELRLSPESIEALAARLAELLGGTSGPASGEDEGRMLSAAEVSRHWGVSRRWVYDHAEALGAVRLGAGTRPRLRFDPAEVSDRLGAPRSRVTSRDGSRSAAIPGIPHSDWLSGRAGAMFVESQITAGGRANAPGPAPKEVPRRAPEPSPRGRLRPPPSDRRRGGGR